MQVNPTNTGAIAAGAKVKVGDQEGTTIQVTVKAGDAINLEAIAPSGYKIRSWVIDEQTLSTNPQYSYIPQGDVTISAGFQVSDL